MIQSASGPNQNPTPEIAVSAEAVRPIVDEADRLLDGVFSDTEEAPSLDGGDNYLMGTRSARFAAAEGIDASVIIDQITAGEEINTKVRWDVKNAELTSVKSDVFDVKRIELSSDADGTVHTYDYTEELDIRPARQTRRSVRSHTVLEFMDMSNPEQRARAEEKASATTQRVREIRDLQPPFSGQKLEDVLKTLRDLKVEDREVLEGSEEPVVHL